MDSRRIGRGAWRRDRRWQIVTSGRPWVFWPWLAVSIVAGAWPLRPWWSWLVAVLIAGPGLTVVIGTAAQRRPAQPT